MNAGASPTAGAPLLAALLALVVRATARRRASSRDAAVSSAAEGEQRVSLTAAVSPEFMARHTPYVMLEDMLDASGLPAATLEEAAAPLASEQWNAFVGRTSQFESWAAMQRATIDEWTAQAAGAAGAQGTR